MTSTLGLGLASTRGGAEVDGGFGPSLGLLGGAGRLGGAGLLGFGGSLEGPFTNGSKSSRALLETAEGPASAGAEPTRTSSTFLTWP